MRQDKHVLRGWMHGFCATCCKGVGLCTVRLLAMALALRTVVYQFVFAILYLALIYYLYSRPDVHWLTPRVSQEAMGPSPKYRSGCSQPNVVLSEKQILEILNKREEGQQR